MWAAEWVDGQIRTQGVVLVVQWDLMGLEKVAWASDDHHGLRHLFTRLCGAVINTTVIGIGSRVIGTINLPKVPAIF